jgi:hypothetical protein
MEDEAEENDFYKGISESRLQNPVEAVNKRINSNDA